MECSHIREFLEDNFLAGGYQLPSAVGEHIENCPECRAAYEELLALGETLGPLADIAMTPAEISRLESGMSRALAEIDSPGPSPARENKIFPIARLALAAAAVLVMMVINNHPDLPSGMALLQNADIWQSSRLDAEDMALLFADGDTDLLPSPMDDQAAAYLTEQMPPAQAEDILESITAEELEWLRENLTLEI